MSEKASLASERRSKHQWTPAEVRRLHREYPTRRTTELAADMGLPLKIVYAQANRLGILKSAEFLASDKSGRTFKGGKLGQAFQFKPGHATWNKGTHWVAGGRSAETRFKKGRPKSEARNYRPVGSERIAKDGYLERKVTDDHPVPARRWVAVHRLVWMAANGAVPAGHAIVFRAGKFTADREEITLDRLELVTRAELMRRNSYHNNYPKDVGLAIQLRGALNRQINARLREEQNQ